MYKLILLFFCFLPSHSIAQNLQLVGHVISSNTKGIGKMYYTENGNNFSAKKIVTYDENHGYTFKMNIPKIKKEKIETLAFTFDPTMNISENPCVHIINVSAIMSSPKFKSSKNIVLKTDLAPELFCEESMHADAGQDGKGKFVGQYVLETKDTLRTINLESMLYSYKAILSKSNPDYINEEIGTWQFDSEKKLLSFNIEYMQNENFGLIILKPNKLEFNVTEKSTSLSFTSEKGLLKKE